MERRRFALVMLAPCVLLSACTSAAPGDDPRDEPSSALAKLRAGRGIAPQSIVPAVRPLALDDRPVRVVVELAGDPITRVQAKQADLKLSGAQRTSLRRALVARQEPARHGLEALGAKVLHAYQSSYNGLSVLTTRAELARIARLPGVVGVHPLRPKKLLASDAASFVSAPAVWSRVAAGLHGESIKVAVIDTGIDYTHADFGGPGTPDAFARAHAGEALPADPAWFGPHAPRVKGGIDLVGDAYDASSDDPNLATPHLDPNPLDCQGHGSHVAGILGGSGVSEDGTAYTGPYDARTLSRRFRIPPGIAPRVDLYAVRVFGCDGQTVEDIDGIEWAVDHDMDVINLSLGTDLSGGDDPSAVAAANAVEAGVVVVAAEGNAGGNPYVGSSPANADGVVAVAAMDASASLAAATLDLGTGSITVEDINAVPFTDGTTFPVVALGTAGTLATGCAASDYERPDVAGALLVELRGDCYFSDRLALAQAAGAAGIALVNDAEGYPPYVGGSQDAELPLFGVLAEDGPALVAASSVTATNAGIENPDFRKVADFSSSGPRPGDSLLKPSVAAPGIDVVSAAIGTGDGGLPLSGTSMATPVVAGLAALARQAHPAWRAIDIANVLANTADPEPLDGYSARRAGAGVADARTAVRSVAVADADGAPAVNFGFIELARDAAARAGLTVRNLSPAPLSFDVAVRPEFTQGFDHALSLPPRVQVPPFGSARLDIGVELAATTPADPLAFNEFAGMIELLPSRRGANGGVPLRVPYYGVVRPEARLKGAALLPSPRRPSGRVTVSNRNATIPGSAEVYAWGIDSPDDHLGCHDVRAAGVEALPYGDGDRLLVFAINGWRRCSSASVNEYDLALQLENGDGYLVAGIDAGLVEDGVISGELGTLVWNLQTGEALLMPAIAPTDSGVVYLTALASELGLSPRSPRFAYALQTSNIFDPSTPDQPAGIAAFNAFEPAVVGVGAREVLDPSTVKVIPVGIRRREWRRTPAKGLMVVFVENSPGAAQARLFGLDGGG